MRAVLKAYALTFTSRRHGWGVDSQANSILLDINLGDSSNVGGDDYVQVDLPIPLIWATIVFIALLVFAYALSMLIALRVRRISAYLLSGGV